MAKTRTEAELKAAVDSIARVRAVESPPEPDGTRTIWHQGAKGADLLTTVNAQGVVTHQEFTLYGDYFEWGSSTGLRTGAALEEESGEAARKAGHMAVDLEDATRAERLARASAALTSYAGDDKFLLHLRGLLLRAHTAASDDFDLPVTRSSDRVRLDLVNAELARQESAARRALWVQGRAWVLLALGGLALALAVAALLSGR